jgi:hypothetical protein
MLPVSNLAYLLLILLVQCNSSHASEKIAHPPAYDLYTPPPKVELDNSDYKRLQHGKRVYKQVSYQDYTLPVIVFRVGASKDKIWQTILNYHAYPDWIKNVDHAQIYRKEDEHYYVNFLVGHWLIGKIHYSVKHYLSKDNWMKWELDPGRTSDFSYSTGYWQVIEADDEVGKFDVFYAADFQFKEARSEFIRNKAIKAGLKQASIWLPREAEKK